MRRQYDAARFEMSRPAGRSALRRAIKEGAQPLDPDWLQERITSPLGGHTCRVKECVL